MYALNSFLVALLILATAFFVAAEFAIVRLRSSRVDQMVLEGRKNALAVQRVTSNLDGYLSACQLGITITALGLGWLGEPTVEKILHPVFDRYGLPAEVSSILSFGIAFASITFLHVVLGELAPKTVAIQKAETVSLLTAKPLIYFYKAMYPFIWALNGSANRLVRIFGIKPAKEHEEAHSEEELRIILTESYKSGMINQAEYGYVNKIFAFDERLAREIMVPRT
ncbi:MAG: hemolysin family protein, partial [Paenibacillus macerans]|nr:hemolysin family protein [Paenibacillus macerans]